MPRMSARDERPLAKTLGAAAQAARRKAGLTQAEVARRVGIQLEVYGRIERGEVFPSVPTLRRLCVVLRIPSDELLGLEVVLSDDTRAGQSSALRKLVREASRLKVRQLKLLHLLAESLQPEG